jgi:hypothetical protein
MIEFMALRITSKHKLWLHMVILFHDPSRKQLRSLIHVPPQHTKTTNLQQYSTQEKPITHSSASTVVSRPAFREGKAKIGSPPHLP